MRLLLDTHALIWHREGNTKLSPAIGRMISDDANQVFISIATLWEMSIKRSLGKLPTLDSPAEILAIYESGGAELLPVSPEHVMAIESLPHRHRDPFDRMLIAQAKTENLAIITKDAVFSQYGVEQVWQ